MRSVSLLTRWFLPLLLVGMTAGCADVFAPDCVSVNTDCAPLYEPTFENVYQQTLVSKCAVAGGACHAAAGGKGGLVLEGLDVAYDSLVGGGSPLVNVATPGCSSLAVRLESDEASYVMPLGAKLSDAERCAIHQWVAGGAAK
jgi:hypothetical protein